MNEPSFLQVANCQYSSEAYIYQGKLEAAGIETQMRDHFTVDANPLLSNAVGGIKIFVRAEDFDAAMKVLSEISTFSVNDDGTLVKCQKCGAEEVEMITSVRDNKSRFGFVLSVILGVFPVTEYRYRCGACKAEFPKES